MRHRRTARTVRGVLHPDRRRPARPPARAAGIRLALDPNLRPALGPVEEQAATVRSLLPHADFLLLGTDEAGAGPLESVRLGADIAAGVIAVPGDTEGLPAPGVTRP